MQRILQTCCLALIGMLLLVYVLLGRGGAHIGIAPIYIGEIVLAASLGLFMLAPDFRVLTRSGIVWLILVFNAWCLLQTLPYLSEYGLDALRDAVTYGYSFFSLIIAAYLADRNMVSKLVIAYDRAITASIILLPFIIIFLAPLDTDIPGEEVPFVLLKAGDTAVHLAGALAFRLLRVREAIVPQSPRAAIIPNWLFWILWLVSAVWILSISRGALMAIVAGASVIVLFGPGRRFVIGPTAALLTLLLTFAALDVRIDLGRRELSAAQILANTLSIVTNVDDRGLTSGIDSVGLDVTASWRMSWWEDIVDYTLFGDYFWFGKGFGENLADSDGYQVGQLGEVRSPHNGHLTILARAGVPGFLLWMFILGSFAASHTFMAIRLGGSGAHHWRRVNVWILAYWAAGTMNMSFDVYLEGPQGGIWYWSILGAGLGLLALEKRILETRPSLSSPASVQKQRLT